MPEIAGAAIEIGRDVSALAAKCGSDLTVREIAGSLENFLGVRQERGAGFGIVQSDVLEHFSTFRDQDRGIARAAEGGQIALQPCDEEIHILALL